MFFGDFLFVPGSSEFPAAIMNNRRISENRGLNNKKGRKPKTDFRPFGFCK